MDEARRHLERQADWLYRRAAWSARKLRPGSTQATVSDLARDLFGDTAVRFLEKADGGWFDERPRVSLEAQVRALLAWCLLQAETDAIRKARRLVPLDEAPEAESHADADEAIDGRRREERVKRAVHDLGPARRLWYLAIHRPDELTLDHVREAAAFRQGGGAAVQRSVDEAWALFVERRADRSLVADEPRWKRTVATIFRTTAQIERVEVPELRRAVNAVDVQLCRAARELEEKLAAADAPDPAEAGKARRLP